MQKCSVIFFRITGFFCLVANQFFPADALATDDLTIIPYIPNVLSVEYGRDNDHGRDMFVYGNLGLSLRDRLIIGLGRQDETVTGSEENLENRTYLLGYNYLTSHLAQFGAEYEFWGDRDKVTIDSFRVIAAFNAGKFAISVTPEFRKIRIDNDSQCDEDIDSGSARINLSIDAHENYSVNIGYVAYDYSNNLTELVDCVSNFEAPQVEARIDSVATDSQVVIGLDYFHDTETYGGSFLEAETALLRKDYKMLSFYASTDYFDDWTLTATLGAVENTDKSSTLFLNGSITYYW